MAPRTPNYSFERLQRERTQKSKSEEKAERRAEKVARRKALAGEQEGGPAAPVPPDKADT
jgi:hypothetical protein